VTDDNRPVAAKATPMSPLDTVVDLGHGCTVSDRIQARLGATMIFSGAQGRRDLVVSSGLHESVVHREAPWDEGGDKGWMTCVETGTQGVLPWDESKLTAWVLRNGRKRTTVTKKELSSKSTAYAAPPSSTAPTPEIRTKPDKYENPWQSASTSGALPSLSELAAWNPSLDIWREPQGRQQKPTDPACVGTSGWVIAGLALVGRFGSSSATGMVTVPVAEIARVLGLSVRRSRDLVDRMERARLGHRERGCFVLSTGMLLNQDSLSDDEGARLRQIRHGRQAKEWRTGPSDTALRKKMFAAWKGPNPGDLAGLTRAEMWDWWESDVAKALAAAGTTEEDSWDDDPVVPVPDPEVVVSPAEPETEPVSPDQVPQNDDQPRRTVEVAAPTVSDLDQMTDEEILAAHPRDPMWALRVRFRRQDRENAVTTTTTDPAMKERVHV
jgi:hypothetical protein